MTQSRYITLLVLTLLFVLASLPLLHHGEGGGVFFPLYGFLFLWCDWRREVEMRVIFLFLVTAAGLLVVAQQPGKAAVGAELGGIWLLNWGLNRKQGWAAAQEREAQTKLAQLERTIEEYRRDAQFYQRHQEGLAAQTHVRREFVEAAQRLGATMDLEEIKSRLLAILKEHYPGVQPRVISGAPRDELEVWVTQKKIPVMVQDLPTDSRFPGLKGAPFRSALVVPLSVLKTTTGFLRLESKEPGAFQASDLRTVDLLSTMASLSMENARLYERTRELAVHDALTQLYTHRSFQGRLQEEVLRAGRSQTPLTLVLADVDHFKDYNDIYGHQAGDLVLKTVASAISRCARDVDFVARYGGEEFVVILPATVRSKGVEFAESLRTRIQEEVFVFQGQKTRVTISLGVSSFPQDATTPSQLIRVADERMYRAKKNGRNQVVA